MSDPDTWEEGTSNSPRSGTATGKLLHPRSVVTAVVVSITAGLCAVGCSSPTTEPLPKGAIPAGTADWSIGNASAGSTKSVSCTQTGSQLMIETGDQASGISAAVNNLQPLSAAAVTINNVAGFTGSYHDKLASDTAKVTLTGRTYAIAGVADGYKVDRPSFRVSRPFALTVSC
jgi:lipoprotein LpqH